MSDLGITLEFGGGAELLVGKVKRHEIKLPISGGSLTLGHLLAWVRDNLVKERPELLLKDPSAGPENIDVRPGILVLINDADWELLGQTSYDLVEGDNVTLISTLHGG